VVRREVQVSRFQFQEKTEDKEATSSKAGTFVPKGPPNETLMRKPLLLRLSRYPRRRQIQKDDGTTN
jgi:hypothetical protein